MMDTNKKLIRLIDLLIFEKKVKSSAEFCRRIGIQPQTLTKIKNGTHHFRVVYVERACKQFNVNANWIFGCSDEVYNEKGSVKLQDSE